MMSEIVEEKVLKDFGSRSKERYIGLKMPQFLMELEPHDLEDHIYIFMACTRVTLRAPESSTSMTTIRGAH